MGKEENQVTEYNIVLNIILFIKKIHFFEHPKHQSAHLFELKNYLPADAKDTSRLADDLNPLRCQSEV